LIRKEEAEVVGRMLRALNPGERAAVILTYWYDLSQAEIAEAMGSAVDAVRTRLHRARCRLARSSAFESARSREEGESG